MCGKQGAGVQALDMSRSWEREHGVEIPLHWPDGGHRRKESGALAKPESDSRGPQVSEMAPGRRQSGDTVYEQGQEEEMSGKQTKGYSFQSQTPCNNSFCTLQNPCRYIVKMNHEIGEDDTK